MRALQVSHLAHVTVAAFALNVLCITASSECSLHMAFLFLLTHIAPVLYQLEGNAKAPVNCEP